MNEYRALQKIIQTAGVRRTLDAVASRIEETARTIATREGIDPQLITSRGTRPKGRPYARVTAPARIEYGDATTPRARVLSRAVRAHLTP